MAYIITKYLLTAFIIVVVSEVAKRTDRIGALIAALPFVTILAMIWLFVEKQGTEKISNHAYYTFWYVFPTLPMFLLMPWMLNKGIYFWWSLGAGCLLTIISFLITIVIARLFGVELMT